MSPFRAEDTTGKVSNLSEPFVPVVAGRSLEVPVTAGRSSIPVVAGNPARPGNLVERGCFFAAGAVLPSVSREDAGEVSRGFETKPDRSDGCWLQQDDCEIVEDTTCHLLVCCQVNALLKNGFESLCRCAATFEPSTIQLGVALLQLLLVSPRDGACIRKWIEAQCSETFTSPTRVRDFVASALTPSRGCCKADGKV